MQVHSRHVDKDYITSERFIHDELMRRCQAAVKQVYTFWKQHRKVHPTLLLWPGDSLRIPGNPEFTGVVFLALPELVEERPAAIIAAAKRCSAYGMLMTEQLETDIRLLFESAHGTRTWRIPIKRHGDIRVLGPPSMKDNTESIGIKWRAN